jgi:hypothetical protein
MRREGALMTRRKLAAAVGIVLGTVIMVAMGASALLTGCGVKSAPIAPEYAAPARILDLRAESAIGGIKLTWSRPTAYVGGHAMRDLAGFVLNRADGDGPMTALVKFPVTDQERFQVEEEFSYLDGETQTGRRYRYAIIAEAEGGYYGAASNEVDITRTKPSPPPNPDTYQLPAPPASPANTP